jgi:hypothetical protein
MTLAIGHKDYDRKTVVVDALREARPPFSPETVANEFARLLKSYRIKKITGDRYAGEWPREQFSKFGIRYEAGMRCSCPPRRRLRSSRSSTGLLWQRSKCRLLNSVCNRSAET